MTNYPGYCEKENTFGVYTSPEILVNKITELISHTQYLESQINLLNDINNSLQDQLLICQKLQDNLIMTDNQSGITFESSLSNKLNQITELEKQINDTINSLENLNRELIEIRENFTDGESVSQPRGFDGYNFRTLNSALDKPLQDAVQSSNLDLVKALLAAGANTEIKIPVNIGYDTMKPMRYALTYLIYQKKSAMAVEFIKFNANLSIIDKTEGVNGETPLLSAAWKELYEVVKAILDTGKIRNNRDFNDPLSVNFRGGRSKRTALKYLVDEKASQALKNLIISYGGIV